LGFGIPRGTVSESRAIICIYGTICVVHASRRLDIIEREKRSNKAPTGFNNTKFMERLPHVMDQDMTTIVFAQAADALLDRSDHDHDHVMLVVRIAITFRFFRSWWYGGTQGL
jgi:hypothetical protein